MCVCVVTTDGWVSSPFFKARGQPAVVSPPFDETLARETLRRELGVTDLAKVPRWCKVVARHAGASLAFSIAISFALSLSLSLFFSRSRLFLRLSWELGVVCGTACHRSAVADRTGGLTRALAPTPPPPLCDKVFATLDAAPVAAASLGQVRHWSVGGCQRWCVCPPRGAQNSGPPRSEWCVCSVNAPPVTSTARCATRRAAAIFLGVVVFGQRPTGTA